MVFRSMVAPNTACVSNARQYPRQRLAEPSPGLATPKLFDVDQRQLLTLAEARDRRQWV